jgi:hypothetical protein
MTNTIYFGQYSQDELDSFGISFEDSPHTHAGEVFEFRVDVYPEDGFLRIQDSLHRMVPIDKTHYRDLIQVMARAISLTELQELNNAIQKAINDTPSAIFSSMD